MDQNSSNQPPNDNRGNDNTTRRIFTETFVFTGSGPSFIATMQNLMNRIVNGPPQQQEPDQPQEPQPGPSPESEDASMASDTSGVAQENNIPYDSQPTALDSGDPAATIRTPSQNPLGVRDTPSNTPQDSPQRTVPETDGMAGLEAHPTPSSDVGDEQPPMPRIIRPLPRNGSRTPSQPHAHFHAHTPHGTIDLFTFTIGPGGDSTPPPPGAPPTFSLNLGSLSGTELLAGFETIILGGPPFEKDREPDLERAKLLLGGMEVVPEGLVRRLEHAGGVPGGHGTEESGSAAGCAVCWGPLLDEVEVGEWDTALPRKEKEKTPETDEEEKGKEPGEEPNELQFQGRIVALPCAHVYHAQCLLPWFSRQTTCPTCRFDVDPDSLTWTPSPPRVPPPPTASQPGASSDQPDTTPEPNPFPDTTLQPPAPELQPPAWNPPNRNASDPPASARPATTAPFLFWPPRPTMNGTPMSGAPSGPLPPPPQRPWTQPPGSNPLNAFSSLLGRMHPFGPHNFPPAQGVDTPSSAQAAPVPAPFDSAPTNETLPTLPNIVPLFPNNAMPPLNNAIPPPNNTPSPPNNAPPPPNNRPPPPNNLPPSQNNAAPPTPHRGFIPLPLLFLQATGPWAANPSAQEQDSMQPRPERRKWTPPDPVGQSLRQRVEQKERELGLRCDDAVCGVGPTDEDPIPLGDLVNMPMMQLRAAYDAQGRPCEHKFHSACLVTSARVAGVTGNEEPSAEGEAYMQVACPSCRAEGLLSGAEWALGLSALDAEMA